MADEDRNQAKGETQSLGYHSIEEIELIEDPLGMTHVDLPDPDDPGKPAASGESAAPPRKRWTKRRKASESSDDSP